MSALISPCGRYRYKLTRDIPGNGIGSVCFIMLNPSTADATTDDPTIRRCKAYAAAWGYAELVVVNLYAWRATSPQELFSRPRGIICGHGNYKTIVECCYKARRVVCAWGVHGDRWQYGTHVAHSLDGLGFLLYCIKTTKHGHPYHPLYCKADAVPVLYTLPARGR